MSIGAHLLAGPNTSAKYSRFAEGSKDGPPLSPLHHLLAAQKALRLAAEAAITSGTHTRHTGQIVELLSRAEDLFERMK